jgi:hypothetical protein
MRSLLAGLIALGIIGSAGMAQGRKDIRFWNLTLYTIIKSGAVANRQE